MNIRKLLSLLADNVLNLVVFAVPMIFWQASNDPFGPAQSLLVTLFLPFFGVLYFILCIYQKKFNLKNNPLVKPFLIYSVVCFLSIFLSINKGISIKYFRETMLYVWGAYLMFLSSGRRGVNKIFFIIVLSHTLMAAYGILQHFDADMFNWSTNFEGRPMGTIGNPDFFAGELLLSIFILLSYVMFGSGKKALAYAALIVNLVCLALTEVAGAYFGLAAGVVFLVLVYVLSGKVTKKTVITVAAATAVLLAVMVPAFYGRAGSFLAEKKHSLSHRLIMWKASALMIKDSPILGKGIGAYRLNYPYYQGLLLNDPKNSKYDYIVTWMPHQNYLLIAAETGLLGLGVFILAMFVFYSQFAAIFRSDKSDYRAVAAASSVTAILGASFMNTFYNIPSTSLLFFFMLFSLGLTVREQKARTAEKTPLQTAAVIAIIFLIIGFYTGGKSIAANIYLKQANKMTKDGSFAEAVMLHERVLSLNVTELCPQTDVAQYYYAAEAYRQAGLIKNAYDCYEKELEVDPFCPEVNNMLGAVAGRLGHTDEALKRLKMAVFVAPHYEAAFTNLATAYMITNQPEKAREVLGMFITRNGPNAAMESLIKATYYK
jgi:O-antigen ligase/Tfp pilus assembly protein PilF